MRVMITAGGGISSLYPSVPLAWAFRAAGHEVRLVGKPQLTSALTQTGLPAVVLGQPPVPDAMARLLSSSFYDDQRPWPKDWPAHPEKLESWQGEVLRALGRYTVAVAAGMADDLVSFARQWRPDLIVYETLSLSVTALTDIPCVRSTHGNQDVWRMDHDLDGTPLPEYAALLQRFGVHPPTERPSYVDTMPPSMYIGGEQPCAILRWVLYNGPGPVPDELATLRRRPRVCVSWGMSNTRAFGTAAANPFRTAIEAAVEAGAEVLVHAPAEQTSSLGTPPDGVRYLAESPLNLILPYCDLHVHHGGYGSAMTAACLGIPQLVITRDPMLAENAMRTAVLGAGLHFRHQDLAADPNCRDTLRQAVDQLLNLDSHTKAAAELREDIERQPTPADTVNTLIKLAS